MKTERLFMAIEVLDDVARAFADMPEEQGKSAEAWLTIADAALYLTEVAHHLVRGKDAYDAVLSAVRGEMLIPTGALKEVVLSAGRKG